MVNKKVSLRSFLWGPQRKPNAVFAMGRAAHIRVFTTKTRFLYIDEDSDRDVY